MKLAHVLAKFDRVQKSLLFKIIASAMILLLAIGSSVAYVVAKQSMLQSMDKLTLSTEGIDQSQLTPEEKAQFEEARSTAELTAKALNQLQDLQADTANVIVGIVLVAGLLLGLIWLGLGLTGLLFLIFLAIIAGPMALWGAKLGEGFAWVAGLGKFLLAIGILTFAFMVLMELVRALFSPNGPVPAIARNVVLESTRMKVALVFIILLVFGMAALPGLLDDQTPLRYRIQSFMQYGAGGSFTIICILTLFLSTATVAFEQREKIIWQTMTKPVAAWQYLLGKWIGVVGVAAVLLGVSCSGVFLFTEYLRQQPAVGEIVSFQPRMAGMIMTEDREILQTQVLSARSSVRPDFTPLTITEENDRFKARVAAAIQDDPNFKIDQDTEEDFRTQIRKEVRASFASLEPGQGKEFRFLGLREARDSGSILTLKYKIDSGANDPRAVYMITFLFRNTNELIMQKVPLGQSLTLRVNPAAIDPTEGTLYIYVFNGDFVDNQETGQRFIVPNPQPISFPPDGLEVFYPSGSYQLNFARVVVVLWLKLALLAMIGIASATCLSFSVASLVSFGVFLVAESSAFLTKALEYYASTDAKGNVDYFAVVVRAVAVPISKAFTFYADLQPISDLIEGRLIPWSTVIKTALLIGVFCAVLFVVGVAIFRKRELATYSGQ